METLVEYRNELNSVKFGGFTAVSQDVFMAFCAQMKNKQSEILEFNFSEIRELLNYPKTHSNKTLIGDLEAMVNAMLKLTCNFKTDRKTIAFVLFPTFEIDEERQKLRVRVNPDFAFLLNDFARGGYTQIELRNFMNLSSKYAKTMYRYLRQYRSTGVWTVTYEEFRELLCVPTKYKPCNISARIIEPALKELKSYYPDLKCEPYYLHKPGSPLAGYKFIFHGEELKGQTVLTDFLQPPKPSKPRKKNKFNDFEQREYNYDELEDKLFNQ